MRTEILKKIQSEGLAILKLHQKLNELNIEHEFIDRKIEKEPHFIQLCSKSNDSMLEVAKNVVLAVENTVEAPEGLELLTTNKNQKVKEKLQELIEYLRIYADWR